MKDKVKRKSRKLFTSHFWCTGLG